MKLPGWVVWCGLCAWLALASAATAVAAQGAEGQPAPSAASVAPGDYPPVLPGKAIVFPEDTGAHEEFRTEWWYVTGWVEDAEGHVRGFQITFFRVRPRIGEDNPSRFAPRQLILAHAALADPRKGRLLHAERAARALPPLAGFSRGHTGVWVDDWRLAWEGGHYEARAVSDGFAFELKFSPTSAPMLNGDAGYSRKAASAGHASYYYSRPQLATEGWLELDGQRHAVRGRAWLDHEWSSGLMPPGARGWDWMGINLDDGGALMAFRMRDEAGQTMWAGGTLRDRDGTLRTLAPQELRFTPLRHWRSPRTGAAYPVVWKLEIAGRDGRPAQTLRIEPLMDDQELDSRRSTGAVYWEGAVRLFEAGQPRGRGYLEMTGYVERLKM